MKATKNQLEANNIVQSLVSEALKNAEFKSDLIQNPEKTINEFKGKDVTLTNMNGGTNVVVEDQTDTSKIYFNIPFKPNLDNYELSEEELESVSGGCSPSTYFIVFIGAAALGYATKK